MVEAIGSGICEFYVEIRSDLRCPIWGTHQANFVAVQKDGTRVLLHSHQQKDEPLRGAVLQYAMPKLLGDRDVVLAVLYAIFLSIPDMVLLGFPIRHMYLGIDRAMNSSLYALYTCIKYKTHPMRTDESFEKPSPIQRELAQG